ncbi:MAG: hypothetical protein HYU37_18250 [Acidobacteria bacterium]|nr:hypothetical protein [Acidobacteriota bacterium]
MRRCRSSAVVLLLTLPAGAGTAAQERPVPSDSSRITIAGCARDRTFIVAQPEGHETHASPIQSGRRFRLSGPRSVLNDIRTREATMVQITGLVRKSDLAGPGGWRLLGGRVRIGGAMPRDPVRDPMYNQTVIDVEGFQLLPDPCPAR